MKSDIFISYSRDDLAEVEPFVKQIEARTGLRCWIDWNGIESGAEFEEKIVNAIDEVKVVLFFVSDHSMASPYAKMEINYAYNTQKKVVPVVLDGGQLRGWFLFKFGSINFIDCKEPRQVDTLMGNLKAWCGGKPAPTPAPAPAPTPAPTPVKTYQVGDFYDDGTKQGVVFEVSEDGRHGKIVSLEQSEQRWSTEAESNGEIETGANDRRNGMANQRIIEQIDDWRNKYPAFAWCADLGKGWYLPALKELLLLLLQEADREKVNQTLVSQGAEELFGRGEDEWYWSSTEDESMYFCALLVYMSDCKRGSFDKTDFAFVRAVAQF